MWPDTLRRITERTELAVGVIGMRPPMPYSWLDQMDGASSAADAVAKYRQLAVEATDQYISNREPTALDWQLAGRALAVDDEAFAVYLNYSMPELGDVCSIVVDFAKSRIGIRYWSEYVPLDTRDSNLTTLAALSNYLGNGEKVLSRVVPSVFHDEDSEFCVRNSISTGLKFTLNDPQWRPVAERIMNEYAPQISALRIELRAVRALEECRRARADARMRYRSEP